MNRKRGGASWAVFLGEPTPTSAKITGTLSIRDENLVFETGIALAENAGLLLGYGIPAHRVIHDAVSIPLREIAGASSRRTKLILRSLAVRLTSGEEIVFQFGAASPARAEAALRGRLAQ